MNVSAGEVLRGIGIVLFIAVLAGAIAYVGDRVGHQVGRKRLTLFGIRPRYTSTIIAVGTGMLIAIVVTLGAILASQQVKLAFFKLNAINSQIEQLQARAQELERKVNNGHVVVPDGSLMSPLIGRIPQNSPADLQIKILQQYYADTVKYVNQQYTHAGLKPFVPPKNAEELLRDRVRDPAWQAMVSQNDVALLTTADQNLFAHDPIHFQITAIPNKLIFQKGRPIVSLRIPKNIKNVSIEIALQELANLVSKVAASKHMPAYFVGNVIPEQAYPSVQQMQKMVSAADTEYILTAFAATDVYSVGGIPIVVTLEPQPAQ